MDPVLLKGGKIAPLCENRRVHAILKWFLQMVLFTLTLEQNPQKMTLKRDKQA